MKQENTPLDVLIIGAGLSGLCALKKIVEEGKGKLSVGLYEANDRVGGRVCTYEKDGVKLDKGASWVGPTQNRMYQLLKEFDIKTVEQYDKGKNQIIYKGVDNWTEYFVIGAFLITIISAFIFDLSITATISLGLIGLVFLYAKFLANKTEREIKKYFKTTIPPISLLALLKFGITQLKLEYYASKINLDNPYSSPNAAKWDSITFQEWAESQMGGKNLLYRLIQCATDTIYGVDMKEISFLHALFYIKTAGNFDNLIKTRGGAQQERLKGGSSSLPLALQQKLNQYIHLKKPVAQVDKIGELIQVTFEDKSVQQAKKIIVAVPPQVLANQSINFTCIPQIKKDFFNSVKAGQLIKIFAIFKTPFWREDNLSGQVLSPDKQPSLIYDLSSETHGILLGFQIVPHAQTYKKLSQSMRQHFFLSYLGTFFDKTKIFEQFVSFSDENFVDEKYILGCPVGTFQVNSWKEYNQCWRQPTDNTIFWASTETSTVWNGYMEGAVISGERAAQEVLASLK